MKFILALILLCSTAYAGIAPVLMNRFTTNSDAWIQTNVLTSVAVDGTTITGDGISTPLSVNGSAFNPFDQSLNQADSPSFAGLTVTGALNFDSGLVTSDSGTVIANGFAVPSGSANDFLKADGSLDSSTYSTFSGNYSDLSGTPDLSIYIDDAPTDGLQYVRQDAGWAVNSAGQSPWVGTVNGAGNGLQNVGGIAIGGDYVPTMAVQLYGAGAKIGAQWDGGTDSTAWSYLQFSDENVNTTLSAYDELYLTAGNGMHLSSVNGIDIFGDNGSKVAIGYDDYHANNQSYKLDVNGDINLTGTIYQNGIAFASGSQTPWTSDIDGDGYNLTDVGCINALGGSANGVQIFNVNGNGTPAIYVGDGQHPHIWLDPVQNGDIELGGAGGIATVEICNNGNGWFSGIVTANSFSGDGSNLTFGGNTYNSTAFGTSLDLSGNTSVPFTIAGASDYSTYFDNGGSALYAESANSADFANSADSANYDSNGRDITTLYGANNFSAGTDYLAPTGDGSGLTFTDNSSGTNWAGTPPTTINDAINRIAAVVSVGGTKPIP